MTDFADRWGFDSDKFWLRGERPKESVEWCEELGRWHAYDYAEVNEALSNNEAYSADSGRLFDLDEETLKYFDGDLAQMTGPEHANIRKQVSHAFSPRFIDHLESRVLELSNEYADKLVDLGRFNLLSDFVDHVAGIVFSELLGIPADDRTMFKLVDQNMDQQAQMTQVDQGDGEGYFEKLTKPLQPLREMLGRHVDERSKNPKDDLISLLSQVKKLDGGPMTRDQIINFIIGILGAGHLATPLLIGNTMLCLESFPDQAAKVRADRSLVPSLLEESMRYLTPGAASYRATVADVELGGKKIPKDQLIRVFLGAANRDPRQFPDPDTFDAARSPNAHLGFGRGAHYCVGGQMVRVETRIVFNVLMDRFPKLRVDPDIPPLFFNSPDFTGVRSGGLWVRTD
ncbi:cytochrome P450 [Streptomyces sporangiiformans]|uniref:Cytochrome P450 n=1 Tax=Streptomyces sporangiiformans TaxID=2315329 RepID=A0A505D4E9_9ACTN|nr:cytochrome P450 [Streptomyces sporangiiformans]TPQ17470.1 cytochrome P450 [Streptomyces sporangiiformans]